MITNPDGNLHVYMLNVGQADTTVIVLPKGNVIIIDAVRPDKLISLLNSIGNDDHIEHLIITHPHDDHFKGGNRLAQDNTIKEATVAPFWHEFGMGPTTYRSLIARMANQGTNFNFLSGYSRWYPEGALITQPGSQNAEVDLNAPYLEMLGPTNGLVTMLESANIFETNHLTIMCRITWKNFRMICAGDAQMENWAFFDQERLMEGKCQILRAAHHGSSNGTQWERIKRLGSCMVVVSSDPYNGHMLPDLGSAAVFTKFDSEPGNMAVLTRDSGTIHVKVDSTGSRTAERYGDDSTVNVNTNNPTNLNELTNPTDWTALLQDRIANL